MKHRASFNHRMDVPDRHTDKQTNKQTDVFLPVCLFVCVLDGV